MSRVPPYSRTVAGLPVRGCHPLWRPFPGASGYVATAAGLFRVRSPLLAESRLMSFPPGTEMFQFPGFASAAYGFSSGYRRSGGLPHSETHGSKPARGSPWLVAACCVLRRLSVPRHPPDALQTLDLIGAYSKSKSHHSLLSAMRRSKPAHGTREDTYPTGRRLPSC